MYVVLNFGLPKADLHAAGMYAVGHFQVFVFALQNRFALVL